MTQDEQIPLAGFELVDEHVSPIPLKESKVNYHRSEVPHDYACCQCGARPCKLWLDHSDNLLCAVHAAKQAGVDQSEIKEKGYRIEFIGTLPPAVPNQYDPSEMWSYHDIPADGIRWWRNLETFPV